MTGAVCTWDLGFQCLSYSDFTLRTWRQGQSRVLSGHTDMISKAEVASCGASLVDLFVGGFKHDDA